MIHLNSHSLNRDYKTDTQAHTLSKNTKSLDVILTNPNDPNDKIVFEGKWIDSLNKSFKILQKHYDDLTKDIPMLEGSIAWQVANHKMSKNERDKLLAWEHEHRFEFQLEDRDLKQEYLKIYHQSTSIAEFKDRFLEFQNKHKERLEQFSKENENILKQEINLTNQKENSKDIPNQAFKPIQSESKNITYKDEIKANFWKHFLEAQKESGLDVFEFLAKLNKTNSKVDVKA